MLKHKLFSGLLFTIFVLTILNCQSPSTNQYAVQTGLDHLQDYQTMFQGKQVGIVTNHTAYDSENRFITEVFREFTDVKIAALFGPEHGLRGCAAAGSTVGTQEDTSLNIPIYSLYGTTRKPTPQMLQDIDILVFDIQDIGSRYYTYISTMALAMEAAAENQVPFVVLDRPDPINGISVEGNILDPKFSTFVGMFPIPVRYGMTVGELAKLFNEEGWLENGVKADLTVIPVKNWKRNDWYDETGLTFIQPSPNMPDLKTATVYPGNCLIEGINVSEGRGTDRPFIIFGAPWIDGKALAEELNKLNLTGIQYRDTSFTPVKIPGVSENPKYENRKCFGVRTIITNREKLNSFRSGVMVVNTIHKMYPDSMEWRISHFDRLCGTDQVRIYISEGKDLAQLFYNWQQPLADFMNMRNKYLLY